MPKFYHPIGWDAASQDFIKFAKPYFDAVHESPIHRHRMIQRFWPSDLPEELRSFRNQPLHCLQLFSIGPLTMGQIHKDGIDRKAAVNIPFSGEYSTMEWFDADWSEEILPATASYIRSPANYPLKPHFSENLFLTEPTIVSTDMWHRVNNIDSDSARQVISIRFAPNPSLEHLMSVLTDPDAVNNS